MLTVAQLVELQIVVLMVVSSILIRQPNREVVQSGRMRALGARGRRFESCLPYQAGVAQLVEQGFCKPQGVGSNPITSSICVCG